MNGNLLSLVGLGSLTLSTAILAQNAVREDIPTKAAPAGVPLPASLAKAHGLARELAKDMPDDEPMPPSDLLAVSSDAKLSYAKRADGAWLFQPGQAVPGQDVLNLTLKAKIGGPRVRVDFLADPSLPKQGAGLYGGNGNFCLSGVSVTVGGKPVTVVAANSPTSEGEFTPSNLIKPASDTSTHEWNASAHTGGSRRLNLDLAAPVSAGAEVVVRLEAKTRWGQHIPGCVSGAVLGGTQATRSIAALDAAKKEFDAWRGKKTALAQAELLRAAGEAQVWEILKRKDGYTFLSTFLADPTWLESFLLGGQEGTLLCNYGQALENLRLIYSQSPKATWTDPVSKRLAAAMALEGGVINRWRLVDSFRQTDKARTEGRLHAGFDQLDVRAMRHAIQPGMPRYQFEGWLNACQFTVQGYLNAAWAVPYREWSTYNYSVHHWGFHDPLYHAYSTPKYYLTMGGVCGTVSRFGSNILIAHGVPSFTVSQPGHCAYIFRQGNHWGTTNAVTGPELNGWTAYEGAGFTTTNALLEKTENAPEYLPTQRLLWQARLAKSEGKDWKASYKAAIKPQPLNYAVWMEFIKALESSGQSDPAVWMALAKDVATTFKEHQEGAWALAYRCLNCAKAQWNSPAERAAKLLELHRILNQKAAPTMYGYDLGSVLSWQANFIGDEAETVKFFGALLTLHYSDNPKLNWCFGGVMGWSNAYFATRPAASTAWAKAMGEFFASLGDKADKGQAAGMINQGIRKAGETGDSSAYRTWQELAAKLLPPVAPADLYLTPQQVADWPEFEPFPGDVLSTSGQLYTSSQAPSDRPLSYLRVLDGSAPGFFDTAPEAKPWAQVTLAGESELSGIVLVNRYENEPEKTWDVPLKVMTSTDGKTWTEVALFDKPQDVFRVDLQGKNPRAKFVRIERQQQPANGRLHMRNFVIYGKKLY